MDIKANWKLLVVCIGLGLVSIAAGQFSQLSYSDVDIHAMNQPNPYENKVPTTTTTTATPTTKKSGGFFSGFSNLFKSNKKKTEEVVTPTTTTTRPTQPTRAAVPVQPTPAPVGNRPSSVTPQSPSVSVTPEAFPALPTRPTPAVPKRDNLPLVPTTARPASPTTPTRRDEYPPLPGTGGAVTPKRDNFPPLPGTNGAVTPNRSNNPGLPTTPSRRDEFPPLPGAGGAVTTPSSIANPWTRTPPTGMTVSLRPGGGVNFIPQSTPAGIVRPTTERPKTSSNGPATDQELLDLSESLFSKDVNNANKFVTVNYQGRTYSGGNADEAPKALLEVDEAKTFAIPTIEKMRLLFNNYEIDSAVNEYVTPNEHKEENDFLDEVMKTSVMRAAMQFLQEKGQVTPDPKTHRDLVKTIWFNLYSRGQGKIGSSGFEHVFVTEIKNGTLIGMHNWLYFYEEEKAGKADYKGYSKKLDLGNKGSIAKIRFDLCKEACVTKPTNSLFIGTSPELELALYTVCFAVRPDKDCPLGYNGKQFNMKTYTYRYRGKTLIGSAYPEI